MIILPDKNIVRTKFLIPVSKKEWRESSQVTPKDQMGNPTTTVKFRIRARLNDGFVKWIGWFDDREDFDAFLWSIANDTLKYEKELWKLPNNEWSTDIGEDLSYDFATNIYLTSTAAGQTWTKVQDWNNFNNSIEVISGGGAGSSVVGGTGDARNAAGGGGGGYAKISNLNLASVGSSIAYTVGTGGIPQFRNSNGATAGGDGGSSSFNTTSVSATSGKGGAGTQNGNATGGAGGVGTGTVTNTGGRGGNSQGTGGNRFSTGGGGAAGKGTGTSGSGNGNQGTDVSGTTQVNSAGGNGDASFGGAGGNQTAVLNADGNPGGNGTEWSASYGSGGGGSGGSTGGSESGRKGGNGGNYGGAGGGCTANGTDAQGGAGIQGLIVIIYEPFVAKHFNLPMLGL